MLHSSQTLIEVHSDSNEDAWAQLYDELKQSNGESTLHMLDMAIFMLVATVGIQ